MTDAWSAFAIVAGGAALAGFVQGLSGFAFAMIALRVWAWALPPQVAAPLAVFGALVGQLSSLYSVRGGYDFTRILPLILGGVIGVPIGVFALHNINLAHFKLAIGVLLTIYGLFGLLMSGEPRVQAGGRGLDAFVGLIGGALGGLGGMSGSVPAIWTQLRGWKRDLRRATMQAYNIAMHVLTLTVYSRSGVLDASSWRLFATVGVAMLIPTIVGAQLYGRFSERTFQQLILALLVLSGLAMIYGAARSL